MRETRIVAVNSFGKKSAENVDLCRRCVTKSLSKDKQTTIGNRKQKAQW